MYRKMAIYLVGWIPYIGKPHTQAVPNNVDRPFDLLRWFSAVSFFAIFIFSIAFAVMLSHFLKEEILQHDAALTNQFIHSIAEAEARFVQMDNRLTLGQILDQRVDLSRLGISPGAASVARNQFYDHLRVLPDALLVTVFARDRTIVWSSNRALVGKVDHDNDELEGAFAAGVMISTEYKADPDHKKSEQQFLSEPQKFFVENYIPLIDRNGEVASVVEIYKEPVRLQQAIHRGNILVWSCTAIGAIFLYLALFGIIRRADAMLNEQKRRLIETEALCVIGEMSAAVAHGIRNPLASIRSSAELALDGDTESTRKNATDIIAQVDRLGKWVRDLLVFSRPVSGESQSVDLAPLVDECLASFATQFKNRNVSAEFIRPPAAIPAVVGNRSLATQALASIISNALEAMPDGGNLRLILQPDTPRRRVNLVVADSGSGMSPTQMELAFKPFYTTKRKGLGLGMALVKRIMERFDGAITLHSQEGAGTQVTLCFNMV